MIGAFGLYCTAMSVLSLYAHCRRRLTHFLILPSIATALPR